MASIHDLPEEIILKMVNFLELKEIAKFGEVSKRMRAISRIFVAKDQPLLANYSHWFLTNGVEQWLQVFEPCPCQYPWVLEIEESK